MSALTTTKEVSAWLATVDGRSRLEWDAPRWEVSLLAKGCERSRMADDDAASIQAAMLALGNELRAALDQESLQASSARARGAAGSRPTGPNARVERNEVERGRERCTER
jgi:hypothetical protein